MLILSVLKVSVREANGHNVSLTVRLYGPNSDLVIDREREMQVRPCNFDVPIIPLKV